MNRTSHCLWSCIGSVLPAGSGPGRCPSARRNAAGSDQGPGGQASSKGVAVRIDGLNGKQTYELKTDKGGRYFHIAVDPYLSYRIVAIKEGYWTEESVGVRASRSQSGGVNNFTMRPGHSTDAEMTRAERDTLVRELKPGGGNETDSEGH